ncbi:MAG TPA: class I SAM-dependent methyltransferase [Nitrospirota bacterium]|nr:class I SAM-dependent methyltransferase [Nitrospirota bacterium]
MASAHKFAPVPIGDATLLSVPCPLCKAEKVFDFFQDKRRTYMRCEVCNLVFVPPSQFLSAADEKRRYDLHQNSPDDLNYRRFLSRIFIPMQNCLNPGSYGLDFGSGPEPLLSVMFEEAGHSMTIFDFFYANLPSALEKQYDFITATEVVEHLYCPKKELERLWGCLKDGGKLGIMTKPAPDREAFSLWHYKNDLTHVCFFSKVTFEWLADQWNADLTFADKDVAIFHKRKVSSI